MPIFVSTIEFPFQWGTNSATDSVITSPPFDLEQGYTALVFTGLSNYVVSTADTNVPAISDNFNLQWQLVGEILLDQYCPIQCWAFRAQNRRLGVEVTLTYNQPTSSTRIWGGQIVVFDDTGGIGAVSTNSGNSTTCTTSLTTLQSGSSLVCFVLDWTPNAFLFPSWETINGITPTVPNQRAFSPESYSNYAIAGAYWDSAGTPQTLTVGLTETNTHKFTIMAVELFGAPFTNNAFPAPDTIPRIQDIGSISNISTLTF